MSSRLFQTAQKQNTRVLSVLKVLINHFKNKTKEFHEILSNYFKNQTEKIPEFLSNCQKQDLHEFSEILSNYLKKTHTHKEPSRFFQFLQKPKLFQPTSNTKPNKLLQMQDTMSSRLFQTTQKQNTRILRVLKILKNYFKMARQRSFTRFFQTTSKTRQRSSTRFFQTTSKTRQKSSPSFFQITKNKIHMNSLRFYQIT